MLEDFQLSSVDGEPVYIDSQGRSMSVSDYDSIMGQGSQQAASTVSQEVASNLAGGATTAGTAGIAGLTVGNEVGGGDAGGTPDNRAFVEQTYINEVGRPGEAAGVDYWLNALNSGYLTRDQLSAAFSGTEEGRQFDLRAATAGTGGQATTAAIDQPLMDYLESKYMSEFGRKSDAEGIKYWYDAIKRGDLTQQQVADIFSKSAEGSKYDIGNLAAGKLDLGYVSPDLLKQYNDLTSAFTSTLYRPGTAEEIAKYLATPGDYAKTLGDLDEAFVQKTYRDILKFAPDAKGLQYWTNELASGRVKRENLGRALLDAQKKINTTPLVNPLTGVVYSNTAQSARAADFGNFPLTAGTRTTDTGEVVPTVRLNLQQRPRVSLGIRGFAPLSLTNYEYDPSSYSLFGGNRLFGGTNMTGAKSISLFGKPATSGTTMTSASGGASEQKQEVVAAANGGVIMSDPVMRRAMFRQGGPVSSMGTGITSNVASPEENAKALQDMFQAPGFRKGGEVQYFQEGGEAVDEDTAPQGDVQASALERLRAQTRNPEPRFKPVMEMIRENRTLPIDREQAYTGRSMRGENTASYGGGPTYDQIGGEPPIVERPSSSGIGNFFRAITGRPVFKEEEAPPVSREAARQAAADQIAEREMYRQAAEDEARYRAASAEAAPSRTAPPAAREETKAPVKDRLSIRLDELRAEREANKEKRRENQLLALMQAGFAAAAGRSPNALANIAAGGISGVQTLAELNKDVRAEDRALRREILETELTQERMREAAAERRAAREQTAAERQRSLLQNVSSNTRQEIASISQLIGTEEAKLLTPGITEEQKAPIKAEIARLKNQREAAVEQMYSVYESLGIKRPRTVEQESGGFKFLGAKK